MRFDGRVVLITGASSGIGAATAVHFAGEGALLSLTGRRESNLRQVAEECKKVGKVEPLTVVGDITNESDVRRIIDETIEKYGKLDVLVNNAGIFEMGSIEETSLDQLDRVFNTNVRGPYLLTILAVPHLIRTKGNIVNVSSIAGINAYANWVSYCMSKGALDQFTKSTALHLAPKGVRVNSVNPAVILTEIHHRLGLTQAQYEAFLEECKKTHALARPGHVKEVASAIAFLASEDSSFVTGHLLAVDGGRLLMSPVEDVKIN